jgi:hypothetical protein
MQLFNTNDPKLLYEISWIIIDVTHNFSEYSNFLMSDEFIIPLYQLLRDTTEVAILKHLFWIFANLFSEENSRIIFSKIDIASYVLEYFAGDNIHFILKDTLLWIIVFMFKTNDNGFIEQAVGIVPYVVRYLNLTFNSDIFTEALDTVYRMSETQNEAIIQQINIDKKDIPTLIVSYINVQTQLEDLHSLYKIANSMIYNSIEFSERLRKAGIINNSATIFDHLTNNYINNRRKEVKECLAYILETLGSLVHNNKFNAHEIIRNTNIPKNILALLAINNYELNQAIWGFFNVVVSYGGDRIGTEILRHGLVDKVCESLTQTNDKKLILICLKFMETILIHGALYIVGLNLISHRMERMEIDTILEKLSLIDDHEISKIASKLYESFFKK